MKLVRFVQNCFNLRNKSDKQQKRSKKLVIGEPLNFTHIHHVGLDIMTMNPDMTSFKASLDDNNVSSKNMNANDWAKLFEILNK